MKRLKSASAGALGVDLEATVLLRVTACRLDNAGPGELGFRDPHQARFTVSEAGDRLFTTEGAPAAFPTGERVAIAAGSCLQWRSAYTPDARPADLVVIFGLLLEGRVLVGSEHVRMYDAG